MPLFEVKGWDVPSKVIAAAPPTQSSKKRKRSVASQDRVDEAQVNLEKLIRRVEEGALNDIQETKKQKKDGKEKKRDKLQKDVAFKKRGVKLSNKNREEGKKTHGTKRSDIVDKSAPSKRTRKKGPRNSIADPSEQSIAQGKAVDGLTSLQSNMKESLDGARFRWINEMLYSSRSDEGYKLMREEPNLFEEYHVGFRQQVRSWPKNPVSQYITELSSYPKGTVIADLGCGDAAIARTLVQKGYCVLSYDLVSDGAFILEADICKRIPLPGSEGFSKDSNQGQIVDVCVCALSLMSLDWIQCIREAWRVLRIGGELKVAEVTSRFANVNQFIKVIQRLGFRFKSKAEMGTHFITFEFEKVVRPPLCHEDWVTLQLQHTILKPCEYKRR